MENLKKINIIWGIIFGLLMAYVWVSAQNDGGYNSIYTLQEYKDAGGNKIDYYLAYMFVAPLDEPAIDEGDEEMQYTGTPGILLFYKLVIMLLFIFIWSKGVGFTLKTEEEQNDVISVRRSSMLDKVLLGITSIISAYGIYYVILILIMITKK